MYWNDPADRPRGTPLSNIQLNAVASNPPGTTENELDGDYAYNPSVMTLLTAGLNQPLSVFFTPTDSTNYTTATKTVSINVPFMPNPNGYSFPNFHNMQTNRFYSSSLTWDQFKVVYPEVTEPESSASKFHKGFYDCIFSECNPEMVHRALSKNRQINESNSVV